MLIEVSTVNGHYSISPRHIALIKRMTVAEGMVKLTVNLVNTSVVSETLPVDQVNIIHHHYAAFSESEASQPTTATISSTKTGQDAGGGTTYSYELKQADIPCVVLTADAVDFLSTSLTQQLACGDRLVTADGRGYFIENVYEIATRSGLPTRIRAQLSPSEGQNLLPLGVRQAG